MSLTFKVQARIADWHHKFQNRGIVDLTFSDLTKVDIVVVWSDTSA